MNMINSIVKTSHYWKSSVVLILQTCDWNLTDLTYISIRLTYNRSRLELVTDSLLADTVRIEYLSVQSAITLIIFKNATVN